MPLSACFWLDFWWGQMCPNCSSQPSLAKDSFASSPFRDDLLNLYIFETCRHYASEHGVKVSDEVPTYMVEHISVKSLPPEALHLDDVAWYYVAWV